jgi:RNA polymerase sigma-70 factor, ECF subfamily
MQRAAQSGEPAGEPAAGDIGTLLRAWSDRVRNALDWLTPIVYDQFHRLASRSMRRERAGHSLQDRARFFAELMRRILVERARRRNLKRGGGAPQVSLEDARELGAAGWDLVALDDALNSLPLLDPRKVQVVEMRFFGGLCLGGLTREETAEVLKVSPVTVRRDLRTAKAWLFRELNGATDDRFRSVETTR